MREILNTLYVTTQGAYVHLDHETLRLEVDGQTRLRVPLHHLGALVVFGNVLVSPFALHRCAEEGRSVTFLDRRGRFKARVEGPQSGNVLLRRAQYEASRSDERSLTLARRFVAGKLHNARVLLLRGARETSETTDRTTLRDAARLLARTIGDLPRASDLDALRGLEGLGARAYFAALTHLVRVDRHAFGLHGRSRRPPRDRANALLSFLYALLLNACRSALETVGLDPQVGFLHDLRPGRPALALDLMEELRPLFADRLALALVNLRQVGTESFEEFEGGAVLLSDSGRRTVIEAWERRRQDELMHPQLEQRLPLALVPQVQARLLARALRGDAEYAPFVPR